MNYLFGYGSIINDASRCSTLFGCKVEAPSLGEGSGGASDWDGAIAVWLQGVAIRSWCYRSSTGFTALGLQLDDSSTESTFGVMFPVANTEVLASFDLREKGYDRVQLPSSVFKVDTLLGSAAAQQRAREILPILQSDEVHIWTYIPSAAYTHEPDEEHPILQSYVDVVIRGCLQWGGRTLAKQLLTSTYGWNAFYLNDTLLSRRPWLHRQDYALIDDILQSVGSSIQFHERKHPEEFASRHLTLLRGLWGVPARNSSFIGRAEHLHQLEDMLQDDAACVGRVEVQGIGGIGKTQLCIEYCYQHYGKTYGFIAWIRAETSASIAADMRRLAFDLGVISTDNKAEEESYEDNVVIEEVRRRLSRCQCQWLLIFDNANDPKIIESYLPRGQLGHSSSARSVSPSCARGHVLITSRVTSTSVKKGSQVLRLECFSVEESIAYFVSILDDQNISNREQHQLLHNLSDRLGHLPLAMAIAAAYMMRCDVSVEEYIQRLDKQEKCAHSSSFLEQSNGEISVMKSLGVTLDRLCTVSLTANKILPLLAYISPDHINKKLICALLRHVNSEVSSKQSPKIVSALKNGNMYVYATLCAWVSITTSAFCINCSPAILICICSAFVLVACGAIYFRFCFANLADNQVYDHAVTATPHFTDEIILVESDSLWELFVEFSLISVSGIRGAKIGSMHRLQQAVLRSRYYVSCPQHLQICMLSLLSLWNFRTHDSSSWSACSNYFEHILVLSGHVSIEVTHSPAAFLSTILMPFCCLVSESAVFSTIFLSRFGTAQGLLEHAQNIVCSVRSLNTRGSPVHLDVISGCITHTLGKVARYRSNIRVAEKLLIAALDTWTSIGSSASPFKPHTCHELGIVYLRLNNTAKAEEYFSMALKLRKQSITSLRCDSDAVSVERLEALIAVHESATLYQMAVISTSTKQYDHAEQLLLQALNMDHAAPSTSSTSRAATLQQLGRVALRRGNMQCAHERLHEALQLYCEVYGEQRALSHVNVVAVRHQLGCVASAQKMYKVACDEYALALQGRRMIYGDDCDHIEIALELQALGQAQFDCGEVTRGYEILQEARSMLYRLLQADYVKIRTCDDSAEIQEYGFDSAVRRYHDCLMNSLLFILHRLRKIAKSRGLSQEASEYDCEIVQHKTLLSTEPKTVSSNVTQKAVLRPEHRKEKRGGKTAVIPPELKSIVALRNSVRTVAKRMIKQCASDTKHVQSDADFSSLRELLHSSQTDITSPYVQEYCRAIDNILAMSEDNSARAMALFKCSDELRDTLQRSCNITILD